ncbi:hypothetical protein THOB06_10291 [Vibrio rotiferianus]|nr:hypothetical protein THOG10_10291 [Vibrio rotiferianus]CAH1556815.1 hypothetical protein THOB06_10291 [Vibrio rotiferianus]
MTIGYLILACDIYILSLVLADMIFVHWIGGTHQRSLLH